MKRYSAYLYVQIFWNVPRQKKNNVILRYEYIVQCIKMLIKKTKIYDFQKQYIYLHHC
jgi:hypothetical protein